jgi:hypothetical protein
MWSTFWVMLAVFVIMYLFIWVIGDTDFWNDNDD